MLRRKRRWNSPAAQGSRQVPDRPARQGQHCRCPWDLQPWRPRACRSLPWQRRHWVCRPPSAARPCRRPRRNQACPHRICHCPSSGVLRYPAGLACPTAAWPSVCDRRPQRVSRRRVPPPAATAADGPDVLRRAVRPTQVWRIPASQNAFGGPADPHRIHRRIWHRRRTWSHGYRSHRWRPNKS